LTAATNPTIDWTTLPERMKTLPIDPQRKVPVPWFVAWVNGAPEFRTADLAKWERAVKRRLCWVCGQRLGTYLTFVLGPMCTITRTTSEPPCHRECAQWSAINCPFLARPHMHRREANMPVGAIDAPGYAIKRNPGVSALWITTDFEVFPDSAGRLLISVGSAREVEWYAEGRIATRAEVEESIRTGRPLLEEQARVQHGAMEALERQCRAAEAWLPAA
jgi:hypothetical protein